MASSGLVLETQYKKESVVWLVLEYFNKDKNN
jgi:hypothetical protein